MDKVPEIVSEMADPECSCRVTFGRSSANSDEIKLSSLERSVELLTNFVRYKYMETSASLVREFKIFAGANALVFAILLVVVLIKQKAALHLIPPTLILIASAALVAYLYLFQQDWLSTILYSDYVGLSYFAYLGLTFAFLCDILMNRGEITAAILEAVFEATGSVAQVGCC
jgi:hypothetical protein